MSEQLPNGWIKHFSDHSTEMGSDKRISLGVASWSRGRLDNIWGVCLNHNQYHIHISGPGSYWQSDSHVVSVGESNSSIEYRRIQRQITSRDVLLDVIYRKNCLEVHIKQSSNMHEPIVGDRVLIKKEDIGQWLTLELDVNTGKIRYCITPNRT